MPAVPAADRQRDRGRGENAFRHWRNFRRAAETPCGELPTRLTPQEELQLPQEINSGLGYMPVGYYAMIESAWRAARGWSVDEHRDRMAAMYSRFSEIAQQNPHAWKRARVAPDTIRNAAAGNPMLAFPYTKLHNTSWKWIRPRRCCSAPRPAPGARCARSAVPALQHRIESYAGVAERPQLHRCRVRASPAAGAQLAGLDSTQLDLVELYSCFPVRWNSCRGGIPPSATGRHRWHALCGRPLNNYVLQSAAAWSSCCVAPR
jgi:acetyl-CoA C-acetyltransferase